MRQIKFRAWDKKRQEIRPVYSLNNLDEKDDYEYKYIVSNQNIDGQGIIDWKDAVLMQFTGLLDKNGKEIYFEDFVEDEVGQIWVVKWNKTEISLLNISTGDIMSMRNNLLIKSNIYENSFNFTPKYTEIPPYPERSNN